MHGLTGLYHGAWQTHGPVLWSFSSARRQQLVTLTVWSDTSTRRDLGQMHPVYSCIICSIWAYCYLLHCKSVAIILLRIWFLWINALSAPLTVRFEDFNMIQARAVCCGLMWAYRVQRPILLCCITGLFVW